MHLLLDSHTLIWFFKGDTRLSDQVRILIEDENNQKLISIASVWELSIKQSIGKLTFTQSIKTFCRFTEEVKNPQKVIFGFCLDFNMD